MNNNRSLGTTTTSASDQIQLRSKIKSIKFIIMML